MVVPAAVSGMIPPGTCPPWLVRHTCVVCGVVGVLSMRVRVYMHLPAWRATVALVAVQVPWQAAVVPGFAMLLEVLPHDS